MYTVLTIQGQIRQTCATASPPMARWNGGAVFMAAVSLLLSWFSALLTTSLTALLLQLLGRSTTWFAHPIFILPLYAIEISRFVNVAKRACDLCSIFSTVQYSFVLTMDFYWSCMLLLKLPVLMRSWYNRRTKNGEGLGMRLLWN